MAWWERGGGGGGSCSNPVVAHFRPDICKTSVSMFLFVYNTIGNMILMVACIEAIS